MRWTRVFTGHPRSLKIVPFDRAHTVAIIQLDFNSNYVPILHHFLSHIQIHSNCKLYKCDFLLHNAILERYMLSSGVRPSIRPFVTSQHCTKRAKCKITQTTPYDSPGTLSFLIPKILAKFRRGHSQGGRQIEVG